MGSVRKLAAEVRRGLEEALPGLRKTILKKLPLAVGAMLEARTANTMAVATVLPLASERLNMRVQWLMRLLANRLLVSAVILEPVAKAVLSEAAARGQTLVLSLDQTDLGERFAVLMVSVRVGERALPLAWHVAAGAANIGFAGQREVLERVQGWLPAGARVLLLADRFYPSAELFDWLREAGWGYRLRLKGNLTVDVGTAAGATTADLARGRRERYEAKVALFASGVPTAIGILQEPGHDEPWIVAMECRPTRARVLDYGLRWSIEPMFADFKSRGFGLEATQLKRPDRLDRLILVMALAMYWCVRTGRGEALSCPTLAEKKPTRRSRKATGAFAKPIAAPCLGSRGA